MAFHDLVGTDPVVRMERLKLLAGGSQLIAIGVLIAAVVAPLFNETLHPKLLTRAAGGVAFALIELAALRILGYLPVATSKEG